jgi:hypothetical protein
MWDITAINFIQSCIQYRPLKVKFTYNYLGSLVWVLT